MRRYSIDAALLEGLVNSLNEEEAGRVLAQWACAITDEPWGVDNRAETIELYTDRLIEDAENAKKKAIEITNKRRAAVNTRWQNLPAKPPDLPQPPAPVPNTANVEQTYKLLVQSAPLLAEHREPLIRWLSVLDAKYGAQPYLSIEGCISQGIALARGDLSQLDEILNQAANGGWRQLYPLKTQNHNGRPKTSTDYAKAINYDAIAAGVSRASETE